MTGFAEDDPSIELAAMAFMAGVGPSYQRAAWPDDIALYSAIAEKAAVLRHLAREDLARAIRNEIAQLL